MKDQPRTTGLMVAANTARLRAFTPARVGLGRTGVSQQIRDVLEFQRAHAQARDAVHAHMNAAALQAAVASVVASTHASVIRLRSAAPDRAIYLQRPDLGRMLDEDSRRILEGLESVSCHLAVIVADGLSALAVERHAPPLLAETLPHLAGWTMAPVCIVEQGRVAIGDEIGSLLGADLSVVLIGERPGLSSPDSLGAYITWHPRPGRTDAERNCISNIRAEGLSYREAAKQLVQCVMTARARRLTGTVLGDARSILSDHGSIGGKP
jgi:ethanolamine ammonia-lyase small subunit